MNFKFIANAVNTKNIEILKQKIQTFAASIFFSLLYSNVYKSFLLFSCLLQCYLFYFEFKILRLKTFCGKNMLRKCYAFFLDVGLYSFEQYIYEIGLETQFTYIFYVFQKQTFLPFRVLFQNKKNCFVRLYLIE